MPRAHSETSAPIPRRFTPAACSFCRALTLFKTNSLSPVSALSAVLRRRFSCSSSRRSRSPARMLALIGSSASASASRSSRSVTVLALNRPRTFSFVLPRPGFWTRMMSDSPFSIPAPRPFNSVLTPSASSAVRSSPCLSEAMVRLCERVALPGMTMSFWAVCISGVAIPLASVIGPSAKPAILKPSSTGKPARPTSWSGGTLMIVVSLTPSWKSIPLDSTASRPLVALTDLTTPVNPRPMAASLWAEAVPENIAKSTANESTAIKARLSRRDGVCRVA